MKNTGRLTWRPVLLREPKDLSWLRGRSETVAVILGGGKSLIAVVFAIGRLDSLALAFLCFQRNKKIHQGNG
jgi:hypothetical protein